MRQFEDIRREPLGRAGFRPLHADCFPKRVKQFRLGIAINRLFERSVVQCSGGLGRLEETLWVGFRASFITQAEWWLRIANHISGACAVRLL